MISTAPSTTLSLTPTERVEVLSHDDDALTVLVTYTAGGTAPPPHLHPNQDETFEVLEGELHVKVGGERRVLGPGDVLDIPRGTVHAMHNPGDDVVRARWTTAPAGRTLEWFTALDAANQEAGGKASVRTVLGLLLRHEDVMQLAMGPRFLVRPLMRLVGRSA